MINIQTILDDHSFEVHGLLRKHKISGPLSIATIQKAYSAKGETFMMELLKIITPTSSFTTEVYDDPMGDALAMSESAATNEATKGWPFWDKILNVVTKTGDAIGSVQKNISSPKAAVTPVVLPQETSKTNMLYFVGAGFIVLIIIILIFKK